MQRRTLCRVLFSLVCLFGYASFAGATPVPLKVFDRDVPGLNISVQVVDAGAGLVDFVFYNQSTVKNSSISHIYFDDEAGLFSTVVAIYGEGTSFHTDGSPHNLPGGNALNPVFEATEGFSLAADAPGPKNGINPGEWMVVTIGLLQGFDFDNVSFALGQSQLRVGMSIIAMPGDSGVVAVSVPLPATVVLFGFGSVVLRTFRRKTGNMVRPAKQVSYLGYGGKQ